MAELERADRQREGWNRANEASVIKQVRGKHFRIAEILDEDETVIRQIFICHEEHPEWTADQIATRIRN